MFDYLKKLFYFCKRTNKLGNKKMKIILIIIILSICTFAPFYVLTKGVKDSVLYRLLFVIKAILFAIGYKCLKLINHYSNTDKDACCNEVMLLLLHKHQHLPLSVTTP